ncbi:MAG: alkaline phosphatase family protein [Prevotellaceae bacterium]|nr:alkaline phosphatase family protein [Prevotellaceae bacterium]
MKTYILGIAALVGMADTAKAQTDVEVPRLVVNVIIDQLRSDYLEAFSALYGKDGFAKLMGEGCVYTHAEYPFLGPDRASAVACLMSGTVPYENGIVGEQWFDRTTLQTICCVDDKRYKGNSTAECTSPQYLAVSTIADELKVTSEGNALVYAIAPERDEAVFSAGHAADGCFWLNDFSGQWCTSSYYNPVPTWLSYYNNSRGMAKSLADLTWEPVSDLVGSYDYFASRGTREPFRHSFSGETTFRSFKASAMVNEEVTRFAQHVLKNAMLGVDQVTDFLSVTYYAGNFDHKPASECPMEVQDTYVRLDAQLAQLIDVVEQKVGKGRVLFVLTSTGYTDDDRSDEDLSQYRIPTGEVNFSRAYLLLNMYLTAVYGQGQYVLAASGNQIYLDLKLIENKSLNLNEVLERSASFLIQMSGVRDVYTSQRLMLGAWTPGIRDLRNAYNPKSSGDILVQIAPGWRLVNENTDERILQRDSYLGFPLIFYGSGIEPSRTDDPVTVDHVAPTLAGHLRIRAPNACSASPLNLR